MHRMIHRINGTLPLAHHAAPGHPYHRGHKRAFGLVSSHLGMRPNQTPHYWSDFLLLGLFIAWLLLLVFLLPALHHMQLISPSKLVGPAAFFA